MAIVEMNRSQSPGPEGVCPTGSLPIEVDHLTKRCGHREVVSELSFVALPGRVTGVLKSNGIAAAWTLLAGGLLYVVRRQLLGASER